MLLLQTNFGTSLCEFYSVWPVFLAADERISGSAYMLLLYMQGTCLCLVGPLFVRVKCTGKQHADLYCYLQCPGQDQGESAQGAEDCDGDEFCSHEPHSQSLAGKRVFAVSVPVFAVCVPTIVT